MIAFRHADPRLPFFWENARQPGGRWHADDEGPVQCLADTPDGAWAEFLRHEEIQDPDDVATIRRALWAIELDESPGAAPELPIATMTGGLHSYAACRAEAARLRASGVTRLDAPSAALTDARPFIVRGGLHPSDPRPARTMVFFGVPRAAGWRAAAEGRPHRELLARVRPLTPPAARTV
jgi:hypothetical protein